MSENQIASKIIAQIKEKIERCIQNYMSLEQTMTYLHENHRIDHVVTRTIWEHLQRDNQDFFKEYYKRCELARQIVKFNDLLAQQIDLMQKFREIDLSTIAPVTQLQNHHHHQDQLNHHHHHHQDQLHDHQDQRIESKDFAYTVNSVSSFIDPFAPTQSDASTSDFRYDLDFENLSEQLQFQTQQQPQEEYYYPLFEQSYIWVMDSPTTMAQIQRMISEGKQHHQRVKQT